MPTAEGGMAKKKTGPTLSAGFALGQNLEKEPPVSRAESVKSFLPTYQSQADMEAQEERKNKARIEREGMNYDLYLLIKNKLAGEFKGKILESEGNWGDELYENLSQASLFNYIKDNPEIYTPNEKDVLYIASNLKELLAEQNVSEEDYFKAGGFLNSFIYAYFNSISEEKRKDLKLNLPNTKDLIFIGAELSFGELEVEEAGDYFGYKACGSVILKARKAENCAGYGAHGNARILVEEVGVLFGFEVHGSAILKAKKAGDDTGQEAYDDVQISVEETGDNFGCNVCGSVILKARKAENCAGYGAHGNARILVEETGDDVGVEMNENAKITIGKKHGSISDGRRDNAQVVLPDGRVLGSGESA
jgi:hypothetical protein